MWQIKKMKAFLDSCEFWEWRLGNQEPLKQALREKSQCAATSDPVSARLPIPGQDQIPSKAFIISCCLVKAGTKWPDRNPCACTAPLQGTSLLTHHHRGHFSSFQQFTVTQYRCFHQTDTYMLNSKHTLMPAWHLGACINISLSEALTHFRKNFLMKLQT